MDIIVIKKTLKCTEIVSQTFLQIPGVELQLLILSAV